MYIGHIENKLGYIISETKLFRLYYFLFLYEFYYINLLLSIYLLTILLLQKQQLCHLLYHPNIFDL